MKFKSLSIIASIFVAAPALSQSEYHYSNDLNIKLSDKSVNANLTERMKKPVLHIEKPDKNGISHNYFDDFNVGKKGLFINNRSGANIIINEVISGATTTLAGNIKVVWNDANLIIANPNGITCSKCSFTNIPDATLITAKITGDSVKNKPKTYENIDGKFTVTHTDITSKNKLSIMSNNISINNSNINTGELNIDLLTTAEYKTSKINNHAGMYDIAYSGSVIVERDTSKLFIDKNSSLVSDNTSINMNESKFINNGIISGGILNISSSDASPYLYDSVDNENITNMVNNGRIDSRKFLLSGIGNSFENNGKITSDFNLTLQGSTFTNNGIIDNTRHSSNKVLLNLDYSNFVNNAIVKTPELAVEYHTENTLTNNGELYFTSYHADKAYNTLPDDPEFNNYTFKNTGSVFAYNAYDNKYEKSYFFN